MAETKKELTFMVSSYMCKMFVLVKTYYITLIPQRYY